MNRLVKSLIEKYGYFIFGIAIFIYCLSYGPLMAPDSPTYIEFYPTRQPLYPIILSFFRLFDSSYWLLLFAQLIFGGFCINYFIKHITTFYPHSFITKISMLLILAYPYYAAPKFGNFVLTEAVCYPGFLLLCGLTLHYLSEKKVTKIHNFCFLFVLFLIISARKQLFFCLPVFVFMSLLLVNKDKNWKRFLSQSSLLILTMISSIAFERSFSFMRSGDFKDLDNFSMEIIVAPMYISQDEDQVLFTQESQEIQNVFRSARQHAKEISFGMPKTDDSRLIYNNYLFDFHKICIMFDALGDNNIKSPEKKAEILNLIAKKLIINKFKDWLKLYCCNVVIGFGGALSFIFNIGLLLIGLYYAYKLNNPSAYIILSMSLFNFSNMLLVGIFEPTMSRYTYYTFCTFYATLLLNVNFCLSRKNDTK